MDRYSRNKKMLSDEECLNLRQSKVCVIGCGGLGGYIIEMLARMGVGKLTVVDGDVFDVTNLNRQLLSKEDNIGMSKAEAAGKRIQEINSDVKVTVISEFFSEENAIGILKGQDLVMDALDSIPVRLLLESTCEHMKIPMIYGAIAGWYGQVATIYPGDRLLNKIYGPEMKRGKEAELGNPSFTPALVASVQVSEALKVLIGRGAHLREKLLLMDLLNNDFEYIELK